MSEIAAPAAPSTPSNGSAPAATPAAPAAENRGAPPRGYQWKTPAQATPKAGQVPVPSQPRTAQQVSTGEPAKPQARAQQPAPTKPEAGAKPETAQQREARIIKHKLASGEEIDIDIAEHLERELASTKRKVKVNGQEREVTFAEALERFPLAEGAHQRFREAHERETKTVAQIAEVERALKPLTDAKTALSVLTKLHGPAEAQRMMEAHLAAIYEREKMPAEQRAALEARERGEGELQTERQKFEQERAEFKAQQEAARKERFEAATKAEITRIQRDFPILLREAGLPVTPRMMARLADAAAEARALKIPYTEKQLAEHVAREYREEMGHFGEHAEPEVLRSTLGKGADKLREAEVARVMSQPGRGKARVAQPGKLPETIKTPDQLRKHLREQDLAAERRGGHR